ncbi:phosphatidylinositol 5-phosphate 4-kinase type-2 alpha-like [Tropilaelaps mercedesae]|uniref:1-phosphatidylinositol-5-phosphate 4-kinase n=1 Tax=Tropilaelaps mercedesae TaxID=418985 RepID=A0A1V9XSP6_9ACAR|nr:phosphatidylinositol 5-phosphate 4-kinase type-2 alpha-like [Tropilaelaps mercedesae]
MLMPDDFKAFTKIKVDHHYFNKENMPSHFKVKEYCPLVFRNLRERFGIHDREYLNSLTKAQAVAIDSPGKSGAKFYLSYDRRFIIKTLQTEEVEQMHVLLKHYHPYVVERHGKTLLPQYIGMYRLTVEGQETYLVVTRNIFSSYLPVHVKYDLKGSTVDREASEKEKEKELPTLKDNDLIKDGTKIHITQEAKGIFVDMLHADVTFLAKMNVMDYSLCLGIHDCERAEKEERERLENGGGTGDSEDRGTTEDEAEDESPASPGIGGPDGLQMPTPPDSPGRIRAGEPGDGLGYGDVDFDPEEEGGALDPKRDIYAIPSNEGAPKKEVYFMALVDVLTNYGVKKRTAQAAKTLKHGAGAEISTIHPEQYAKRFLEFITKALE